jgi:hypothetical protein
MARGTPILKQGGCGIKKRTKPTLAPQISQIILKVILVALYAQQSV